MSIRPKFLVPLAAGFGIIFGIVGLAPSAQACEDVVLPLDDDMAQPSSFSDYLTLDTSLFMLRGLVADPDATVAVSERQWVVDCGRLSAELRQALAGTLAADGTVDPGRLRTTFEAHYLETLAERGHQRLITPTLLEFKAVTGFATWRSSVVGFSVVKRKTRRIFRSPAGVRPAVSVSQTHASETGDVSTAVLETEVAVERANGSDWDFYSYNEAGDLVEYSTFPAGQRPAPRICIACHYDAGTRGVQRFFP